MSSRSRWSCASLTLVLMMSLPVLFAADLSCTITDVHDGDTMSASCGERELRIRVSSIDAPELAQRSGPASQRFASELLLRQIVNIHIRNKDRYGRTVARITLADGRDFGRIMVRSGEAWHYRAYSTDPELAKLEAEAHAESLGVWSFGGDMRADEFRLAAKSAPKPKRKRSR